MIAAVIETDLSTSAPFGRHALWRRVALLILLVVAFGLVLITFLNYANYRKVHLDLNLARYLVVGKDLRQTIEAGLSVGLSPAANTRIHPAMALAAQRQAGIRYIAILDESGALLGAGALPEGVGAHWQDQIKVTALDAYWQADEDDCLLLGLPFSNDFGIKVGAVVIAYDKAGMAAVMRGMLYKLCQDMAKTFALSALMTAAGAYLITRAFARDLDRGGAPTEAADAALADDLHGFEGASRRVNALLAGLEVDWPAGRQDGGP